MRMRWRPGTSSVVASILTLALVAFVTGAGKGTSGASRAGTGPARAAVSRPTSAGHPPAAGAVVRTGAERVLAGHWSVRRGLHVGLVTHRAAVTVDGRPDYEVLAREGPWDVRAVFTPEHGLGAEVQGHVRMLTLVCPDGTRSVPVRSLYGSTLKPRAEDLAGLDALVVDLQDVGARFYTYGSTLERVMAACSEQGIRVIVLDRPNPLGGAILEGGVLERPFRSFTGPAEVAVRHGLTLGELAGVFARESSVSLEVVPMEGWNRAMLWPATGRTWTATSPAMRSFRCALAYPGACFFEASRLDVRLGDEPFLRWGAPWLDVDGLVRALSESGPAGVRISAETMPAGTLRSRDIWEAPAAGHPGLDRVPAPAPFPVLRLEITDPEAFRPVELAIRALVWLQMHHGPDLALESRGLDRMAGTDRLRLSLMAGSPYRTIMDTWTSGLAAHSAEVRRHWLYR